MFTAAYRVGITTHHIRPKHGILFNHRFYQIADLVTGLALATIGILALRGVPIGHLSSTTSLLMATGGGGYASCAIFRLVKGEAKRLVKKANTKTN
ncbi:MAG: hypothetical protein K940chlam9_00497, partial [Chlamydiae bacterium]|nr:hypothetical protein [Chlamydiota bacterium]